MELTPVIFLEEEPNEPNLNFQNASLTKKKAPWKQAV